MHKVILVSFLKDLPVSLEFQKYPNHITLIPYFETNFESLFEDLNKVFIKYKAIDYTVLGIDYFGPEKDHKVSRVSLSEELLKLHTDLMNLAKSTDPKMPTVYCYEDYAPHITHNFEPFPEEGDKGVISRIYLVEESTPEVKRIISKFNLTP